MGISHWQRLSDAAMPPRVKTSGNYVNSRLALIQARRAGFDDALLTDREGRLTEGPGYNVFVVRDGVLLTPPVTQGILEGVTRDTIMRLAGEVHDIEVAERLIDKTEAMIADEAFFCGSGKEVRPIASVDHHPLRVKAPGPDHPCAGRDVLLGGQGRAPGVRELVAPRVGHRGARGLRRTGQEKRMTFDPQFFQTDDFPIAGPARELAGYGEHPPKVSGRAAPRWRCRSSSTTRKDRRRPSPWATA